MRVSPVRGREDECDGCEAGRGLKMVRGGLIAALLVVKRISLTVASLGLLRIHTTSGRSLRSKPVSRKSPAT